MAVYGTDAAVQKILWGEADTNKNNVTTQALTTATAIINAFLNITTDISSPSAQIAQACNLIASGLIQQEDPTIKESAYYTQGMKILELSKGDKTSDVEWGVTYPVTRD